MNDFMRMVRLLFHFEYLDSRDRLKRNFDLITAAQDGNKSLMKLTEEQFSPAEFSSLSVDFVNDFCTLMADANFSLLTQKEWDLAKAENFMFDLPIDIAWDKHDKELLGTFLKQNPAVSVGLTQFADSALVFKRGNGEACAEGMFIMEKINMLFEMLLMEPVLALIGRPKVVVADINDDLSKKRAKVAKVNKMSGEVEPEHREPERINLRRLLPNVFAVLRNLFSTHKLKEPTFKEVVIMYRMAKPMDGMKGGPGGEGPLILKSFHDIPMADMEMIFPEVNIQVRFQDMLINVSLAVIAIGTFFWTLMTGVKFTKEITTLISVLVGKVLQSFTALMAKQKQYAALMSKAILAKSDNSQLGMLMHLMESMEDQECKEMILSYCILSANVKSMTLKEIDTKCEFLLQRRFNLKVDFDVEGAMVKLMREGLVEQRAGVLYTATPLRKALQRLDTKWDNLFNYTEDGGAAMKSNLVMQDEKARRVRYQTVEAELAKTLANTDAERAVAVGKLKEQQDEIAKRIKTLESAMKDYKWRTG
jgi:hypothetical protein